MTSLKVRGYNYLFGKRAWRISPSGVLIGALIDIVSSFLLGIPFIVFTFVQVGRMHLPKVQQHAAMVAIREGIWMRSGEWLAGVACSTLGGYIAAKIANRDEVLNGALSAIFCEILGLYWMLSGKNIYPMWLQVVYLVSGIVFACVGGYLRVRQVGGRAVPATYIS